MGIYLGPLRFTKRGVRVRIGPRAARLHVGAGGAGISTGAGPFTAYHKLGGGHRAAKAASQPNRNRGCLAVLAFVVGLPLAFYALTWPTFLPHGAAAALVQVAWIGMIVTALVAFAHSRWADWSRARRGWGVAGLSLIAIVGLGGVIGAASGASPAPASNNNPAPAVIQSSSPAPTTPAAQPMTQQPVAQPTTQAPAPVQTTQPAPVHTTTAPPPPPPPAGCSPKTPSGGCYAPGEFCPTADAGMIGTDASGQRMQCILESGRYHWHLL